MNSNILLILLVYGYSSVFGQQLDDGSVLIQECSSELTDLLSVICRGRFNPPTGRYKKFYRPRCDLDSNCDSREEDNGKVGFVNNRIRRSLIDSFKRNAYNSDITFQRKARLDQGLSDECCSKPCTIDEMKKYCGLLY